MIYGYCRISSRSQIDNYSLMQQEQEILCRYPDAKVFKEQFTGTTVHRPIFESLLDGLQSGDTIAVTKLDRFARTTVEGIELVKELFKRGISVHVFNIGLLEDTPMGQFYLTVMLAVAELERNNIVERTQNGKEMARKNPDYKEGRPQKQYPDFQNYLEKQKSGLVTVDEACKKLGISKSQWYLLRKQNNPPSSKSSGCPVQTTLTGSVDTGIVSCSL